MDGLIVTKYVLKLLIPILVKLLIVLVRTEYASSVYEVMVYF